MKILHCADLHLGRNLYGFSLLEDQEILLKQIETYLKERQVDLYIIAGDIFDRSIPPAEAVEIFSHHLSRIALNSNMSICIIAGNHDSPERLTFGAEILQAKNIFITGKIKKQMHPILLHDTDGPVSLYAIPFFALGYFRFLFPEIEDNQALGPLTYNHAFDFLFNSMQVHKDKNRKILIAHTAVLGSERTDSERPLLLGGIEAANPEIFKNFQLTALGHLHKQQSPAPAVFFSGSLMKYSISEISVAKSVSYYELDGIGALTSEILPLVSPSDLLHLHGYLNEFLSGEHAATKDDYLRNSYIYITLQDHDFTYEPMERLRKIFPKIVHLDRQVQLLKSNNGNRHDIKKLNDLDLLKSFFHYTTATELTSDEIQILEKMIGAQS